MRKLPDILTEDEEQALLGVFNLRYLTAARNRLMILLALQTGMRVGDLINLRFEDVERDTGRCHLKNGKGAKDRVLFLRAGTISDLIDLADLFKGHNTGLVFTTLKGERPVQAQYLRRMIAEKAKKAGISKRVHFHLLRHTYLTRLYSETKNIRLVQQIAGHTSIATTQIYTHISGADVREAMLADPAQEKKERTDKKTAAIQRARLTLESLLEPDEDDEAKTLEKLQI
jgi:integrase/recombinase XerD